MVVYRKTSIEKITLELSDVSMLLSHCQWKKMTVLSWFEYKLVEKYYIIDICLRSHVHSFAWIVTKDKKDIDWQIEKQISTQVTLHSQRTNYKKTIFPEKPLTAVKWFMLNSCLLISGVFSYFWSELFTFINRKKHTFDLLTVKGDTFRLLIVKCVSYD